MTAERSRIPRPAPAPALRVIQQPAPVAPVLILLDLEKTRLLLNTQRASQKPQRRCQYANAGRRRGMPQHALQHLVTIDKPVFQRRQHVAETHRVLALVDRLENSGIRLRLLLGFLFFQYLETGA